MLAYKKTPNLYTGRPTRPVALESDPQRLISVRLEPDGFIQLSADPLLGDWDGLERCMNRLSRAVSFPNDAPRNRGKRHATRGRAFDLAMVFDRLNQNYFQGLLSVSILWAREAGKGAKRKRSIQFGLYCFDDREIRIHPLLDSPQIPLYYMEYIVYHEMCHAYVGIEQDRSGRPRYHGPKFKEREKQYEQYALAMQWEEANRSLFFEPLEVG